MPAWETPTRRSEPLIGKEIAQVVLIKARTATEGGIALGGGRFEPEIAAMLGRRTWRGRPGRHEIRSGERGAVQIELPI
jgi:hypothetical protein